MSYEATDRTDFLFTIWTKNSIFISVHFTLETKDSEKGCRKFIFDVLLRTV